MPWFVRIGASAKTVSGTTSKGYHIWRRGKKVFVEYGLVHLVRGSRGGFYWAGTHLPVSIVHSHGAESEARDAYRSLVNQKLRKKHYERLPAGSRIRHRRKDG